MECVILRFSDSRKALALNTGGLSYNAEISPANCSYPLIFETGKYSNREKNCSIFFCFLYAH